MKTIRLTVEHPMLTSSWTIARTLDDRQELDATFIHVATEQALRARLGLDRLYLSRREEGHRSLSGRLYEWDLASEQPRWLEGTLRVSASLW